MLNEYEFELLCTLKEMQVKGPQNKREGICNNVDKRLRAGGYSLDFRLEVHEALKEIFPFWEKFSRDICYPVPHQGKDAYDAYHTIKGMWNKRIIYGRNRWELLDFCVQYLETK